jgi:hexulose-6-phosphate isomerase
MNNSLKSKIGFMQGRFSDVVDGKIQVFPWQHWREEFALAHRCGFSLMEWTLDQERLHENPLMTATGRREVKKLMMEHGITIPSLTGDCFMQAPFYKALGRQQNQLHKDMDEIIRACAALDIKTILMPLVDGGRLENDLQEEELLSGLTNALPVLEETGVVISFESDFPPERLARFIDRFDSRHFGITYDIGNSASLGYRPEEEIRAYGSRIVNVHVKDRILGGTTVPLGKGDADLQGALRALHNCGYSGNYILQTARAADRDHVGVLCHYRDMVVNWLQETAG